MNPDLRHFPDGKLPTSVQEAYFAVIHIANKVLRECRLFSLETLQEANPTISEIAQRLLFICKVLESLADFEHCDELLPSKAREYAEHIRLIARAVDAGDESELHLQVDSLNRRSFI